MKAGTFPMDAICSVTCPVEDPARPDTGRSSGLTTRGASLPRMENVNWLRARSMQYAGAWPIE